MTKSQEDFMSMVYTTLAVLNDNTAVWQKNVPLSATIKTISTTTDEVTDQQSEQDKTHTGITNDKKKKRTMLESNMIMVAHILAYLGATTNNAILQEEMDFSPTDLSHLEETKLLGRAKIVTDEAGLYSVPALPFGLTPELITAINTSYNDFSTVLKAPRIAIIGVSEATDTIAELIGELRTLLKTQLDKGMMLYRDTPLYGLYQKARMIVNSPTHHLAMTAAITDADGNPVENVKITIVNGTEKVLRKSSPKGNIRVQNLLDGEHTMTVEKPGFETQVIKFVVASPETTAVSVVMK